jgi:hypothetical protein
MAKTTFQNGTIVTSDYLNTMYLTNGGHVHDGGGEDGHAPKINLAQHVSGKVAAANIGDHSHGQNDISKVNLASDITGILPAANGGFVPVETLVTTFEGKQGISDTAATMGWVQVSALRFKYFQFNMVSMFVGGIEFTADHNYAIDNGGLGNPDSLVLIPVGGVPEDMRPSSYYNKFSCPIVLTYFKDGYYPTYVEAAILDGNGSLTAGPFRDPIPTNTVVKIRPFSLYYITGKNT